MAMEFINIQQELDTKESGEMINSMVREKKIGQIHQFLSEIMWKE